MKLQKLKEYIKTCSPKEGKADSTKIEDTNCLQLWRNEKKEIISQFTAKYSNGDWDECFTDHTGSLIYQSQTNGHNTYGGQNEQFGQYPQTKYWEKVSFNLALQDWKPVTNKYGETEWIKS